jgi:prepilin-type N-terminal cleavage/methylation domain-containing protein
MKKELLHINKRNIIKGFSLVEILVAISVFLIFVTASVNIIVSTNKQLQNSNNKERAAALSEEGLEAVRNIRDNNFSNLVDGTYGLSSGTQWNLLGSSDITDIFTRSLNITSISTSQKKVVSTITWSDQISQNNSVSESTYLTNWQLPLNIGLTIDKMVINHGGLKTPADFHPYDLNTLVWDNSVEPPVQNIINIPIIFSPLTMNLGSGVYDFSVSSDPNYVLTLSNDCIGNTVILSNGDAKLCSIVYEENVIPTITTPTVANITTTTATLGANVTALGVPANITERGTCWGTTPAPTTNCVAEGGIVSGVFTQERIGFNDGTLYYYRGYATNGTGIAYSEDGSFTTGSLNVIPTVTTPTVANITTTTATLGANVTSLGIPASISARGTCYGTSPNPTLINGATCLAEGGTTTGVFTQTRTGFTTGTLYYYAGYATNSTGTGYSADGSFTTSTPCSSVLVGTPTLYNSSGTTTASVNKPTGVTTNDIMFAHILHNNGTDRLSTIPFGWAQIGRHKSAANNQALYYKVATSTEGANYSFGFTSSSKVGITISAYRGCFNTTTPIDTSSNVEYISNNTIYRAESINLTSPYTNVLMFPSMYTTSVRTFANPLTQGGGWVEDYDQGATTSDFSRAGYRKLINSTGLTGVIDSIGQTGVNVKHAFAVALKPL